jgi:hypothetical protein
MSTSNTPSQPSGLSDESAKLALAFFSHVEQQISLATTTAYWIVAADALLIWGYLLVIKEFNVFHDWPDVKGYLIAASFWVAGILLIAGLCFSFWAACPRIDASDDSPDTSGIFFYGRIAELEDARAYITAFHGIQSDRQFHHELLSQVYEKSKWLKGMCRCTRIAIWCTVGATGLIAMLLTFMMYRHLL